MKQSKTMSLLESLINITVGFGISLGAQMVFLPLLGVAIDFKQNLAFALIMTAISIARSYLLRRLFEALHIRLPLSASVLAVIAERARQQTVEGFDAAHDEKHSTRELALAGAAYLEACGMLSAPPATWPWGRQWWKPADVRRDLVRGCALGLAALDRLESLRKAKAP